MLRTAAVAIPNLSAAIAAAVVRTARCGAHLGSHADAARQAVRFDVVSQLIAVAFASLDQVQRTLHVEVAIAKAAVLKGPKTILEQEIGGPIYQKTVLTVFVTIVAFRRCLF